MHREENGVKRREARGEGEGKEMRREEGREIIRRYDKKDYERREKRQGKREWSHKKCGLNIECRTPFARDWLSRTYQIYMERFTGRL